MDLVDVFGVVADLVGVGGIVGLGVFFFYFYE